MCNLFFCKKSNRCKEWYLMIIIGKWILYWKAFLCLSMIYYILLQTSTGIISLKNTTTNRHIESANLIYIALLFCRDLLTIKQPNVCNFCSYLLKYTILKCSCYQNPWQYRYKYCLYYKYCFENFLNDSIIRPVQRQCQKDYRL